MTKLKENKVLEFKKSTAELRDSVKSICAILNKHGKGELYFGIKNDGTVVGQDVSDKTLRSVSQAIADHIEPRIYPKIEKITEGVQDYIKVSFQGNEKP